jgi:uncharacterized protein
MPAASHQFQIFVKPTGSICNLRCQYCYYLEKEHLYPEGEAFTMPDDLLDTYIVQHIEATPTDVVNFSWHGGEPTILGLDYFRKIVETQRRHKPPFKRIVNGIQTNGTLLDDEWCRFLSENGFYVGISIDGPEKIHDQYRHIKDGKPTHHKVIRGYGLLQRHHVPTEVLCVVNANNVQIPLEVYRYFKQLNAHHISFLPLVESDVPDHVNPISVPPVAWGRFLSTIFDEWIREDIGKVKVQIFEEALRTAFNQEHSLCIFRPTCGDVPVLEHNGDFYSCDHFVDPDHFLGNLKTTPLTELIDDPRLNTFGEVKQGSLPRFCRKCSVIDMCNGECPKNRLNTTPDGEPGLNYLCEGYKQFFTHCKPFVSEVAAVWKHQNPRSSASS